MLLAKRTCNCANSQWRLQRMALVVLECAEHIRGIKDAVEHDRPLQGAQLWDELTNDEKIALWIAPSNGGIFSTQERNAIRAWRDAVIRGEIRLEKKLALHGRVR